MKKTEYVPKDYINTEYYLYTKKSDLGRYEIYLDFKCISSLKGLKNHLKWVDFYVKKYDLEILPF